MTIIIKSLLATEIDKVISTDTDKNAFAKYHTDDDVELVDVTISNVSSFGITEDAFVLGFKPNWLSVQIPISSYYKIEIL